MDLRAFLQLSCQLVDGKQAFLRIFGYDLQFDTSKNFWQISTKICCLERLPLSLLNSIALSRFSFLEKQGFFLRWDLKNGSLFLTKKIKPLHQFEDFEVVLDQFIKVCSEWKSLVEDELLPLDQFSV